MNRLPVDSPILASPTTKTANNHQSQLRERGAVRPVLRISNNVSMFQDPKLDLSSPASSVRCDQ
jgi:hypothetical protein